MQVPEVKFDDVYDLWVVPWWRQPNFLIMVSFAVILLFVVLYITWRCIKKRTLHSCPYRSLIDALETLRNNRSLAEHDYAVCLSILLREFITRIGCVDCRSCTETEFAQIVDHSACDGAVRKTIKELCAWSVWPKFSPLQSSDLCDGDLCVAKLIDQLKRVVAQSSQKK